MKSKIGLLIFFIDVFSISVFAQDTNRIKIDETSQMKVLIGLCNRNGLKSELFKPYYESEYSSYIPDTAITSELKKKISEKNIFITILMGSWCGDSQEQVPRFYKILDAIGYSDLRITLYCVDRKKKCANEETNNLNITYIPTFIFYQEGKEIGRIVESPKETLENDMLEIVSL